MTDADVREFDSSVRMTEFFGTNNNLLKDNAKAVALNTALTENIATLETAGANRVSAFGLQKDGTIDKAVAKDGLYTVVRNIIETAKTIKKAEPNFDNVFKVRRGTLSGPELLEAGRSFFENLTAPIVAKFVEFGLSATLAARLTEKINAFEAARTQQNTGRGSGVAATAQTKATIKSLKANRRTLKTIVENLLAEHGDAGLIAEWKSACKVEKPKSPTPPATPTP